jgi:hypothetical protein
MSTSNKTIREMRLEAESLLAEAKSLGAKGEEITPEDAVQINEKTDLAAKLIDTITQATASDGARKLADSEAALKALGVPDRPGFGNGGTGNFTQVQPGRSKDYRVEGFGRVSLGESLIHHDAYKSFNPGVQGSALGIEFPNLIDFYGNTKATFDTAGSTVTQYDRQAGLVLVEQQRLTIADLLAKGQTDMNTIRYVRETPTPTPPRPSRKARPSPKPPSTRRGRRAGPQDRRHRQGDRGDVRGLPGDARLHRHAPPLHGRSRPRRPNS